LKSVRPAMALMRGKTHASRVISRVTLVCMVSAVVEYLSAEPKNPYAALRLIPVKGWKFATVRMITAMAG
ncbi:MAG TPA: hypothetical protein PK599_06595, partial [bacterium]|nr:hypothetical protein [bacterium]